MIKKLRVLIFLTLFSHAVPAAADNTNPVLHTPRANASFDCANVTSSIEKLICSDSGLGDEDKKLSDIWHRILKAYSGEQRASLIKGQKIWLNMRGKACRMDDKNSDNSKQVECFHSLYEQRIAMLDQQLSVHKEVPDVDFDSILDNPVELSAYSPEDMGALYLKNDSGFDFKTYYLPKTCRELFTFSAGSWSYSDDTIGINAGSFSRSYCAFLTLSRLDKSNASKTSKQVIKKKMNKAVALIQDEAEFHDIKQVQFGDFTHQNRSEVLAIVFSHDVGTLHFSTLYLGHYDQLNKEVVLERVDVNSPFKVQARK